MTTEMAGQARLEADADALSGLEDRIHHAISLVGTLRKERDAANKDLGEALGEIERLSGELASLRDERAQVRSRIEKLLGHIDQLSL